MKTFHYLLLLATLVGTISCGKKHQYQPIEGYNGKVKSIITYEYKSEIDRNRQISKYGEMIPSSIERFNRYGLLTSRISIDIDDEIFYIWFDSIQYNNYDPLFETRGEILCDNFEDLCKLKTLEDLLNSTSTEYSKWDTQIIKTKTGDNVETETTITQTTHNINKQKSLYTSVYDLTEEHNCIKADTTTHTIKYDKHGRVINKQTDKQIIWNEYGNNLLTKSISIDTESNDTLAVTKYSYINNSLREEHTETPEKDIIKRYDENGRIIYDYINIFDFRQQETVNTYNDTSCLSTTYSVLYEEESYYIDMSITNKDGLTVFTSFIDLGNEDRYINKATRLLEQYRDNNISLDEFETELEDQVLKMHDSERNNFTTITYSEFDSHNNPLKIKTTEITMTNSYSYFSDSFSHLKYYLEPKVYKHSYTNVKEKVIEYYD